MKKTLKIFSFLMALICMGFTSASAQPTTAAPTPKHTQAANAVSSLFSEHFTNTAKFEALNWNVGDYEAQFINLSDNDKVGKVELGWSAISTGTWKIHDKDSIHIDIYYGGGGEGLFNFGFQSWGGSDIYLTDWAWPTPVRNQWISIDVPVSLFKNAGVNVEGINVLRLRGSGTYYFDNFYAYNATSDDDDQDLGALVPTIPAPAPTRDAETVKSMFSDVYDSFTQFNEQYADWSSKKTVKSIITPYEGSTDRILKIENIENGSEAQVALGGRNISDMDTLHLDIYSPGNEQGIGEFDFSLVSGWTNPPAGQAGIWLGITSENKHGKWISIEVPLSKFKDAGVDLTNVTIMRFRRGSKGSPGKLLYVDNVYTYKGNVGGGGTIPSDPGIVVDPDKDEIADTPHKQAPTPTTEADLVKSMFSNSYTQFSQFNQDYADWATNKTNKSIITPFTGDDILKIDNIVSGSESQIAIGGRDFSDMEMLHLDIYSPGNDQGIGEFDFSLVSGWNPAVNGQASIWLNITEKGYHGQWISIDIPMSIFKDAGVDMKNITIMRFRRGGKGSSGKLLYVDNVYAYKKGGGSTVEDVPTTVPTFTLAASDVKSIFCEQYETTGYQDSDLGIKYDGLNYGQNANQTVEIVNIIPDNQTIKLSNWNDMPFKIHKNSTTMDLSDMEYLHVSAFLSGELDEFNKSASITIWMHDNAGKNVTRDVAFIDMEKGKWVSVSIPMCYFEEKIDLSNVYVLRLRLGGYNSMEIYADNIFAYKGTPIGKVAECPTAPPCTEAIADKSDGVLPNPEMAFLGVNLASASGGSNPGEYGYDYIYPKFEDLYYFKAKGVRLIRLPFRWQRLQSELNGELTEKDVTEMKKVIKEAERLGMWVMLDMHDYCERNVNGKLYEIGVAGHREWTGSGWGTWVEDSEPFVTAEHFADAWVKLATAFQDCSNIWGYDLMNEPKGIDINILKDNYQTVINEIRKVDTKAKIVIEGKNYSGAKDWPNVSDELKNLTDPSDNIMYQAHTYFDADNSGRYEYAYDTEVRNPEVYKERLDPFIKWLKDNNKKGMLGEFGVPFNGAKNSDPRYMDLIDKTFKYLQDNQMTATYWCGGALYDAYHITIQPNKNYCEEKSTMAYFEKYAREFDNSQTSIESNAVQETGVSIYPNPVIDVLTIESVYKIVSYEIYNLQGQLLKSETLNSDVDKHILNIADLVSGTYFIRVISSNTIVTQKIIKR